MLLVSSTSSILKLILIPIDTLDVFLQVEGKEGIQKLRNKISNYGIKVLYCGVSPPDNL